MVLHPCRDTDRLVESSIPAARAYWIGRRLTKSEGMGNSLGCTSLIPSNSAVVSVSCFENFSLDFGVGVQGFPTLSRAPPRKNGIMSTETP
jgi:hypothetical protein